MTVREQELIGFTFSVILIAGALLSGLFFTPVGKRDAPILRMRHVVPPGHAATAKARRQSDTRAYTGYGVTADEATRGLQTIAGARRRVTASALNERWAIGPQISYGWGGIRPSESPQEYLRRLDTYARHPVETTHLPDAMSIEQLTDALPACAAALGAYQESLRRGEGAATAFGVESNRLAEAFIRLGMRDALSEIAAPRRQVPDDHLIAYEAFIRMPPEDCLADHQQARQDEKGNTA